MALKCSLLLIALHENLSFTSHLQEFTVESNMSALYTESSSTLQYPFFFYLLISQFVLEFHKCVIVFLSNLWNVETLRRLYGVLSYSDYVSMRMQHNNNMPAKIVARWMGWGDKNILCAIVYVRIADLNPGEK